MNNKEINMNALLFLLIPRFNSNNAGGKWSLLCYAVGGMFFMVYGTLFMDVLNDPQMEPVVLMIGIAILSAITVVTLFLAAIPNMINGSSKSKHSFNPDLRGKIRHIK